LQKASSTAALSELANAVVGFKASNFLGSTGTEEMRLAAAIAGCFPGGLSVDWPNAIASGKHFRGLFELMVDKNF
jgi:hypothetical protein